MSNSGWKISAEIAFVLHVLMSFGLVVNAPESSLEDELDKLIQWFSSRDKSESTGTTAVGTPLVASTGEDASPDSEPCVRTEYLYMNA